MKSANNIAGIPIGTIVAYAGPLDKEWLKQQGWLYCDGSRLKKREYISLFLNMGQNYGGDRDYFNLPDLRRRFVRGLNNASGNDPDAVSRQPSNIGGPSGDNLGSIQGYATSLPVKSFTTTVDGKHSHDVPHVPKERGVYKSADTRFGEWTDAMCTTLEGGLHTHTISGGGDKQTSPINAYVYFIIKFIDENEDL